MDAVEVLTAPWGLGWIPKRITVSTIGKMRELRELLEETKVHVAVSVHSPFAQERRGLMPVENAYPVRDVMEMLRGYDFAHQRRLSVEYIMWRGVNDSMRHADAPGEAYPRDFGACEPDTAHAIEGSGLGPCDEAAMVAFRDHLNGLGVTATDQESRGEDIMAACGLLAGKARI